MREKEIVAFVMSAPEVRAEFQSEGALSLQDFVRELEEGKTKSSHVRLIHAATLILLGQESAAAALLQELPPFLHRKDVPHCNQLAEALKSGGGGAARDVLQQTRQKISSH